MLSIPIAIHVNQTIAIGLQCRLGSKKDYIIDKKHRKIYRDSVDVKDYGSVNECPINDRTREHDNTTPTKLNAHCSFYFFTKSTTSSFQQRGAIFA